MMEEKQDALRESKTLNFQTNYTKFGLSQPLMMEEKKYDKMNFITQRESAGVTGINTNKDIPCVTSLKIYILVLYE